MVGASRQDSDVHNVAGKDPDKREWLGDEKGLGAEAGMVVRKEDGGKTIGTPGSWFKSLGDKVVYARELKKNIRKLVADNIVEVLACLSVCVRRLMCVCADVSARPLANAQSCGSRRVRLPCWLPRWLPRSLRCAHHVRMICASQLRHLPCLWQVEKQLQVGLQVGRERTQKLSQLQNNIQIINRVLTKISILHSWGASAAAVAVLLSCAFVPHVACMFKCGGACAHAVIENECSGGRLG